MKKVLHLVFVLVLALSIGAQAATTIIESRLAGGMSNTLFTWSGPGVDVAKSTASGLSGTGSFWASETTPVKWGQWSFKPGAGMGGYYDVSATWAANTVAAAAAPTWLVKSATNPTGVSVAVSQVSGANQWNTLAIGKKFNAGTTYTTRLSTAASGIANKKTYFDAVKWTASTPGAATLLQPGAYPSVPNFPGVVGTLGLDGLVTVNLSWTPGSYTSFFDVFLTTGGTTSQYGTNLAEGTSSLSVTGLLPSTAYTWKVVSKNVDMSTDSALGDVASFATVPEPGTVLSAMALLAPAGLLIIRRRA